MDIERQKKRQSLRIIVSEFIMVLAVIVTVTILAFIVSGYWINSDFEVERQGMLQISSVPTGATVEIDGDTSWLQRTNTSKVLSSGEHEIVLTKDGYDSWSKTVNIKEGLLYRLHYPRLFLNERALDHILPITGDTMATVSPDHSIMVFINNTTKWSYLNLNSDKLETKPLDISKFFSSVSLAESSDTGLFTGEILKANWDYDNNHILFKVRQDDKIEWVLIDVHDITKSINLTKEFGSDFSNIEILDNSANNLLAVRNHSLHKIDVSRKQISSVLVENVTNFDHFENEIVFTAKRTTVATDQLPSIEYYIGLFKLGEDKIAELETFSSPVKVVLSKFYDKKYITVLSDNQITVHPKDNYTEKTDYDLSFAPNQMKVGHDGEFILLSSENNLATLDMEADLIREWTIENTNYDWLDNDMLYVVSDGELIVYDFDGFNRRSIAKNTSSHFPVAITNNKWLYYVSDDELVREWLIEH